MKLTIRELRPHDMDAFADLCATRLDRAAAERRAELVSWLAFRNPHADGQPEYFIAVSGQRILAHLGRMATRFQMGREQQAGSYLHDLYVDPEVRRSGAQGFFTSMKLYKSCEQASPGLCVLIWTNDINISLQKARKYHEQWVERRVKVLAVDNKLDRLVRPAALASAGKPAARTALRVVDRALKRLHGPGREVRAIHRFDQRWDAVAARLGPRMGAAPVKDHAYLNWKYMDRPQLDAYAYAAIDEHEKVRGFVVLARAAGEDTGRILELVCDPNDRVTVSSLLVTTTEHFRRNGAAAIECVFSDPRLARATRDFLYVVRGPRQPLFLARLGQSPSVGRLRNATAWHLCSGDSEGPI